MSDASLHKLCMHACMHHTLKRVAEIRWYAAEGTDHPSPQLKISASSRLPNNMESRVS